MQINKILGNVGVLYVGSYNPSKQYEYLNCVTYDGSSYVCVNQNGVIGVTPGTTSDWQLSAKKGDVGPVGPKPINGVDYNTDEEKEEFKNDVVSKATEEVEKNVADIENEAIENYNKNATQKITEYNTNANTQVESFNTNATSKTNDFNSNATTKTNEFNAVVDAEKEEFAGQTEAINHHIAVVSDELERVKNDILETGTATGSTIHLEDSAMAEYQELSVDGVCEQESTKGINYWMIAKLNSPISKTSNGINFTRHIDGTFDIYGTATEYTVFNVYEKISDSILKDNTTYSFKDFNNTKLIYVVQEWKNIGANFVKTLIDIANGTKKITFTDNSNYLGYIIGVEKGKTVDFKNVKIELEESNKIPTTFEPYTGGQPSPNPEYPQPISVIENSLKITSCNKNLFDKTKILVGYRLGSDGLPFLDTSYFASEFIKVKPNTTYICSAPRDLGGSQCICLYDKEFNFIVREFMQERPNYKITTGDNAHYIRIADINERLDDTQLEENTQATSYEEHLETQITANLPEGEFIGKINDTYKDTLKVEYNEEDRQYHLNLYKNVGKVVLDGSENWKQSSFNNSVYNIFIDDIKPQVSQDVAVNNVISDRFFTGSKSYNDIVVSGSEYSGYITATSDGYITFKLSTMTSITMWKEWLSNNITTAYYPLKEEKILDLGVVDQLITYNEITNLFTDSDLMPTINAKYYRNFISTVRNLQVNEKSLKQELIDINNRLSALESATTNVASESEVVE